MKLCPAWVAPNLLTLVGFICCVGHFLLLTIYDYDFTAGTAPPDIRKSSIHLVYDMDQRRTQEGAMVVQPPPPWINEIYGFQGFFQATKGDHPQSE